jgi:hypothetical protein
MTGGRLIRKTSEIKLKVSKLYIILIFPDIRYKTLHVEMVEEVSKRKFCAMKRKKLGNQHTRYLV